MIAILSLLLALALSLVITRVAAISLTLTGLARQSARFQARSAFTGVGFTTAESERVVNHPVRRRILMTLMLVGNAGVATVLTSLILTFLQTRKSGNWLLNFGLLLAGLVGLWFVARSRWLDRQLERFVGRLMRKYTHLDVRDYAGLLHLGGQYRVVELPVEEGDWLAEKSLQQLKLTDEGVTVLGVQTLSGEYFGVPDGETVIRAGDTLLVYGRSPSFERLAQRREGSAGNRDRVEAVSEQLREKAAQKEHEKETGHADGKAAPKTAAPTTAGPSDRRRKR